MKTSYRHLLILTLAVTLNACAISDPGQQRELLELDHGKESALYQFEKQIRESPKESANFYQAARLYLDLGQLERARERVKKALLLESQNASYRLLAGRIEFAAQDYFQAINHLTTALQLDNRLLEAHYHLGLSYAQTGKNLDALKSLNQALELEPLYFDAGLASIQIQFQAAQSTEAFPKLATQLEEYLRIKPRSIEGNLLLAELYNRLGAGLKAKLILEDWLKRFEARDQILYSLAKMDMEAGYPEEARASLRLMKRPSPKAKLLLLRLESEQKSNDPEVRALYLEENTRLLIEEHPKEADLWLFLGQIYFTQGDLKKAERNYQKALRIEPKSGEAYFLLSDLYRRQGDHTGAKWAMNKALELEPTQLKYQLQYLESLIDEGKWQSAKDALHQFQLDPNHPQVVFLLGRISQAQGDVRSAREHYTRASRLWGDLRVELRLAELEITSNELNQAEKRLQRLTASAPKRLETAVLSAKLYFAQNRPKRVIKTLQSWKKTDRAAGRVQLYLAEALAKLGKRKQAIKILKQALTRWPGDPDLTQSITFHYGISKRYKMAIPYLEDAEGKKHRLSQLLHQRLLLYYQLTGKGAKVNKMVYQPPI